jgi:hypothetical protein
MKSIKTDLELPAAYMRMAGYALSTQLKVMQILTKSAMEAPMIQMRLMQLGANKIGSDHEAPDAIGALTAKPVSRVSKPKPRVAKALAKKTAVKADKGIAPKPETTSKTKGSSSTSASTVKKASDVVARAVPSVSKKTKDVKRNASSATPSSKATAVQAAKGKITSSAPAQAPKESMARKPKASAAKKTAKTEVTQKSVEKPITAPVKPRSRRAPSKPPVMPPAATDSKEK